MSHRLLIHVGYPKAASTWLQRSIFPLIENFTYPPSHQFVDRIMAESGMAYNAPRVRDYVMQSMQGNLLISSEHLIGDFDNAALNGLITQEVAYRLHRSLPEAEILIILREQVDMIASCYKYYILNGGTADIFRYMGLHQKPRPSLQSRPQFSLDYLLYSRTIDLYQNLFGPEQTHIALFDHITADKSRFIDGLQRQLSVRISDQHQSSSAQNIALKKNTLRLAKTLNRFTRRKVTNKTYWLPLVPLSSLKRMYRTFDKSAFAGATLSWRDMLDQDTVQALRDYYTADNQVVESLTGLDLQAWRTASRADH